MVWISEVSLRRKPSLSASRMATRAHSGMSKPFAQQVDADQHVEGAQPQIADDLDPLQGLDIGMHVAHADALLVHIFGEVFRHLLGQGGDQDAIAALGDLAAFGDQIVHLGFHRTDFDRRIDQARWAGSPARRRCRRCAPSPTGPAWPRHRPICGRIASHSSNFSGRLSMQEGRRKPYSDKREFAAIVAFVHARRSAARVTWLSSAKTSALSGRYSNRVGGGSPGWRPVSQRE